MLDDRLLLNPPQAKHLWFQQKQVEADSPSVTDLPPPPHAHTLGECVGGGGISETHSDCVPVLISILMAMGQLFKVIQSIDAVVAF